MIAAMGKREPKRACKQQAYRHQRGQGFGHG
jgi:hypothetical protein